MTKFILMVKILRPQEILASNASTLQNQRVFHTFQFFSYSLSFLHFLGLGVQASMVLYSYKVRSIEF